MSKFSEFGQYCQNTQYKIEFEWNFWKSTWIPQKSRKYMKFAKFDRIVKIHYIEQNLNLKTIRKCLNL
jgi:hypothetical protein